MLPWFIAVLDCERDEMTLRVWLTAQISSRPY
jgi:hypothetical protein